MMAGGVEQMHGNRLDAHGTLLVRLAGIGLQQARRAAYVH
jgi:hypothetical protein